MTDISTWNAVDDSNNAAAPAGWPEGMMPSGVNNAARAMQGALKRWRDQSQPTVTATGSGDAQIITYPVAPAALASGDVFCFFALANTGPATLQVNAQAAKPVRTSVGTALIGGEMPAGAAVMVVYDGTNFRMLAAPTPLSISNGGTGQTTPAAAADAIGAVKDTGDTMTGPLEVPNIRYSTTPNGLHGFSFGWDGQVQMYVDGTYIGPIGDIASVSAGNGLTGGGSQGALSLAMSGSYSGNFSVSSQISSNTMIANGITSNGNLNAASQISSNTMVANGITCNGNLGATGQITCGRLYSSGQYASGDWKLYVTDEIWCARHIIPVSYGGVYSGLAAYPWAGCTALSFPNPSDRRLKTDIQELPDDCAALVSAIVPKRFRWRSGMDAVDPTRTHWGFIAQEVGEVFSAAGLDFGGHSIGDDAERTEALDVNELVAVLFGAVKELTARVSALETALTR
jgi:hypothetical protein